MTPSEPFLSLLAVFVAALLSAGMTWALLPVLLRHAMATPNARSSHRIPTPQGAGIAVIAATLVVAAILLSGIGAVAAIPVAVFAATLFMAAVGFADDLRSIPVAPRLLLQAVAVGAVILAVPGEVRMVPSCPIWIERCLVLLAGLWFVNLVNFMDGLDWMTVAEIVPITGAMILIGWLGDLPAAAAIVAASLCGAMLGFAPFNRPVARIFLGDVGSLPIGLLVGWCLLLLACRQQFAAALLLPMYYLLDATTTLLRRLANREPFWAAHRSHFYQRATDNGFSVPEVVREVLALNIGLAALAIASIVSPSFAVKAACLAVGAIATALLLRRFARPRGRA